MKEIQKIEVRRAGARLAGDVVIRVPKTWLAAGAVALAVLVLLAFD
ncbi:hypothetical protein [Salinarimonas chemoclinalis]